MLGRIFENLLAEINPETGGSARKSTGSYYTPRVIVDYMIDQCLLLYLKHQTQLEEVKLKTVISYDLNDDEENPLTEEEREQIISALEKISMVAHFVKTQKPTEIRATFLLFSLLCVFNGRCSCLVKIHFGRSLVIKGLVKALLIIKGEIAR
jgi:hypothetical protein